MTTLAWIAGRSLDGLPVGTLGMVSQEELAAIVAEAALSVAGVTDCPEAARILIAAKLRGALGEIVAQRLSGRVQ